MRRVTPLAALLTLALIASACLAQPPGRQRKPGAEGARRPGADGARRPGADGFRRPGADGRDAAQMVARMMQQFDKDGDKKLDIAELTSLFKAMRERRGGGGGRPGAAGPGRRPGGDAPGRPGRPGADRKPGGDRRRGGGDAPKPGGDAPKRPDADPAASL